MITIRLITFKIGAFLNILIWTNRNIYKYSKSSDSITSLSVSIYDIDSLSREYKILWHFNFSFKLTNIYTHTNEVINVKKINPIESQKYIDNSTHFSFKLIMRQLKDMFSNKAK